MIIKGGPGGQALNGTSGDDVIYGYNPSGVSAVTVTPVVTSGLTDPLYATYAPGDANGLYIVQQGGVITRYDKVAGTSTTLSISDVGTGGERGVLGLAFHPDYASNGRFFVYVTNGDGDVEVREYDRNGASSTIASATETRLILTIEHSSASNHNGGAMAFSPTNGLLYIAVGDGGTGGDTAQDGGDLLGKILRIDVNSTDFGADTTRYYHVPASNYFADLANDPAIPPSPGVPGSPTGAVNDAIFAMGVRNPWRFSFDSSGNLWIGDVGQGDYEEVDFVAAGSNGGINFGWNIREGNHPYGGGSLGPGVLTNPIYEYDHSVGSSITGGFVYDGPAPALQGKYIFGDFITGKIFALTRTGATASVTEITSMLSSPIGAYELASFGLDAQHNLYVVKLGGEVVRLTPHAPAIDGNDTLAGGAGRDFIYAGAGNDRVNGQDGGDFVYGEAGNDLLYGGTGNDGVSGGDGNDTLDGGWGIDTMTGGAGADTYYVDHSSDEIRETGADIDRVASSASYTLAANIENLTLTGTARINAIGNALNNVLSGNAGANFINGADGDDYIAAGAGNDGIYGGNGRDAFVFNTTPGANNVDRILDYNVADDTIRMENAVFTALGAAGVLSAAQFYIGAAAADANDHVIYNASTGALYYDSNGNSAGGMVQFATLSAGLALTNQDFLIT